MTSHGNKSAWQAVSKLTKCKRCGDEQVAWVVSQKTGKYYLATAYVDGPGFRANKLDPHFKHCPACICPTCEPESASKEAAV
jgi:hypothetical protein